MLEPGDELVIWKLDRIGRNVLHALLTFQSLAERNVNIRSITDGVDLSTASGRYNFRNILSAAQYESDLNSERTLAGLAVARAKGRIGGRKPKFTDEHWDAFEREIKSGCSHRDIALKYGVGLSTLQTLSGSARASVNTFAFIFALCRMCLFGTFWQCKIYRVLVQKNRRATHREPRSPPHHQPLFWPALQLAGAGRDLPLARMGAATWCGLGLAAAGTSCATVSLRTIFHCPAPRDRWAVYNHIMGPSVVGISVDVAGNATCVAQA
jgi:hypothetical protein